MNMIRLFYPFAVACTLFCGCAHTTYVADAENPEVEFTEDGSLLWRGRYIELGELPGLLEDAGVDRKSQIDIRVSQRIRSLKAPRQLLFILRRAGYTRGVLVTRKRAYSESPSPSPKPQARDVQLAPAKKIRYK